MCIHCVSVSGWWPAIGEATMKPTVIVRSVKRSWPACLLLAGTIQFVSTAPAQAGLFDFLFGNQQPRQPVYAPPPAARPHGEPLAHDKARRDAKRTKPLSANADGPSPTIARDLQTVRRLADVAQKQGITAALMQDPTLRSGDIVVTATVSRFTKARRRARIRSAPWPNHGCVTAPISPSCSGPSPCASSKRQRRKAIRCRRWSSIRVANRRNSRPRPTRPKKAPSSRNWARRSSI